MTRTKAPADRSLEEVVWRCTVCRELRTDLERPASHKRFVPEGDRPVVECGPFEGYTLVLQDPTAPSDDDEEVLPALLITFGDAELWAECGVCGVTLGSPLRPNQSLDLFAPRWERHSMTECEARHG